MIHSPVRLLSRIMMGPQIPRRNRRLLDNRAPTLAVTTSNMPTGLVYNDSTIRCVLSGSDPDGTSALQYRIQWYEWSRWQPYSMVDNHKLSGRFKAVDRTTRGCHLLQRLRARYVSHGHYEGRIEFQREEPQPELHGQSGRSCTLERQHPKQTE